MALTKEQIEDGVDEDGLVDDITEMGVETRYCPLWASAKFDVPGTDEGVLMLQAEDGDTNVEVRITFAQPAAIGFRRTPAEPDYGPPRRRGGERSDGR